MNKQGSPSGIAPNELRHVENGRYREDGIISRGGQSKYSATPFTGTVRGIVGFGPADGAPLARTGSDSLAPDVENDDGNLVRPASFGSQYPRLYMLHDTQHYVFDPDVSPSWQKYPTAVPGSGAGDCSGAVYGGGILMGGEDAGDPVGTDIALREIFPVPLPPGETFLGVAQKPRVRIQFPRVASGSIIVSFITARGRLYFATNSTGDNTARLYSWDGTSLALDNAVNAGIVSWWPTLFRYADGIGWASAGSSQGSSDFVNFAQIRSIDGVWTTLPFEPAIVSFRCRSASATSDATVAGGLIMGGWNGAGNGIICGWDGSQMRLLRTLAGGDYVSKLVLGPNNTMYYLHGNIESPFNLRVGNLSAGIYADTVKDLTVQFSGDGTLLPEDMAVFRDRLYVLARNTAGGGNGFLYSGPLSDLSSAWTREATWTPYGAALSNGNKCPFNRLVPF